MIYYHTKMSRAGRTNEKFNFQFAFTNAVYFHFSFVNFYLFYLHRDNGSGIINVLKNKNKKHPKNIANSSVVQIRQHVLAIGLSRTTASSSKDHLVFFCLKTV